MLRPSAASEQSEHDGGLGIFDTGRATGRLLESPVNASKERYQQFQDWYPKRIEQI